mgnify:CR=1 FL=1
MIKDRAINAAGHPRVAIRIKSLLCNCPLAYTIELAGVPITNQYAIEVEIASPTPTRSGLVPELKAISSTTGPITATGTQTTTGQLNVDNLRMDGNALTATDTNGGITITPDGTGSITLGGEIVGVTNELNAVDIEVANVLRANKIQSDTSDADIEINSQGTGAVAISSQLTLTGSFKPAIHTFTATDAITEIEHAGRTCLLGEVGGNANVVLTLPDATGSGNIYHFIVSVAMGGSTTYKIQVADADNTIAGQIMYLDEDGTAVTSFPTVAASDTITLNSGTQGGLVGDTLTLIDIATDKYAVFGQMRVSAGANPATPFSAAVS